MNEKLVFVVDDDALVTKLVALRLESAGFLVRTFAYGEDCISAISEQPDLIILDFYFLRDGSQPMNGMEVFEKIRSLAPGIPVIMLSAQEDGEVVLEVARKGIAGYVIKDENLTDNLQIAAKEILKV